MASAHRLPDPIRKRDLLYAPVKTKGADHVAIGDRFADQGRILEAVEFYLRGEAPERIRGLRARAIALGDAPLLFAIADALPREVGPADWGALGSRAVELGKYSSTAEAFARAGKPDRADEARVKLDEVLGRKGVPAEPPGDGPEPTS